MDTIRWRALWFSADIGDRLTLEPAEETGFVLRGPFASALAGEDSAANLAWRAALRLIEVAGVRPDPFRLTLEKALPVAAGLGGGSSDAGAALRLVREVFAPGIDVAMLDAVAAELGSDGAACLLARPVLAQGTRGAAVSGAPPSAPTGCAGQPRRRVPHRPGLPRLRRPERSGRRRPAGLGSSLRRHRRGGGGASSLPQRPGASGAGRSPAGHRGARPVSQRSRRPCWPGYPARAPPVSPCAPALRRRPRWRRGSAPRRRAGGCAPAPSATQRPHRRRSRTRDPAKPYGQRRVGG